MNSEWSMVMVDLLAAFDGCEITDLVCLSSGFLLRRYFAVVVADLL